jgi:hypothetical protein
MEQIRHRLDDSRGRANVRQCWTVCKTTARCCFVSREWTNVTCRDCLKALDPEHKISCGHGFKAELPAYRGVRLFEMNCGEIRCALSECDYFGPDAAKKPPAPPLDNIKEWIDAALKGDVDGWLEIDADALMAAQRSQGLRKS